MVKKIFNKEQIDSVKSSLYYKIFDIIKKNDNKYYLDKDFNLIWDENKDVVGIIYNNNNIFFSELENSIIETDEKMKNLSKIQSLL